MSSTIDERVVEMQFNNKQFEKNAQSTIKTLDSLNKSLDLKNASNSFKDLDKAAKSVDLSDISRSMDQITNKISIFGTIGDQVLRNLTNRAADFAIAWAKDLTIGQVQKGWSKYEAKTQAVQVIMHATGQTIDEVNTSLDDLTWYTDQTSYSFDQMIDAISKFTGAGVALEDAEKMSEGIANWAASAGVSASKAAPAFYNLSQAMSSGALRAQDWKSIELLNMNTVEFEEKAIEIAQAMIADGRASKEMAAAFKKANPQVQGFRDSLSTGWLSKEVMVELFKAYGDRTTEFGNAAFQAAYEAKSFTDAVEAAKEAVASGWANIFEQIFGNYEEAKVFWTEVADAMITVFSAPTTALSELLTEWHKGGGYVDFIDSIRNAWAAVMSIGEAVAETFAKIIPPLTSDHLISVTERLENLTRKWRNFTTKIDIGALVDEQDVRKLEAGSAELEEYKRQIAEAKKHNAQVDKNMQGLRETFEGIFAIFKLAGTVTSALFKIALPFTRLLVPIAKIVGSITSALGRMSSTIVDAILDSTAFSKVIEWLTSVATAVANALSFAGDKISEFIKSIKDLPIIGKISSFFTTFYASAKEFASPYLATAAEKIKELFSSIKSFISENAGGAFENLTSVLADFGKTIIGAAGTAVNWLISSLGKLWEYCKNLLSSVGSLSEKFTEFWNKSAVPTSKIGAQISEVSTLSDKIRNVIGAVIDYIRNGGLKDALTWLSDTAKNFIWEVRHIDWNWIVNKILSISAVIEILRLVRSLTSAIKTFKGIGDIVGTAVKGMLDKIGGAFASFSGLMNSLSTTLKGFTKGLLLKRLAISILALAVALYLLSKIPTEKLLGVSIALAALGLELVVFSIALQAAEGILGKKGLANPLGTMKAIASMIGIAISALLLAKALKKISEIGDFATMMKSVVALLAIVAIIVGGVAVMSMGSVAIEKVGLGLLILVAAILLVVFALDKIQQVFKKVEKAVDGLDKSIYVIAGIMVGLAAGFAIVLIASKKIESSLWQIAVVILAIGISLYLAASAIKKLSLIKYENLWQAVGLLVGLLAVMTAIGFLAKFFTGSPLKGILGMAGAIIAVSASLTLMVLALTAISLIGPDKLKAAIDVLAPVVAMLGALLLAASFMKPNTGAAIKGLALVIGVLVAALLILTKQNYSKILSSAILLSICLATLMAGLSLGAKVFNAQGNWRTILSIAAIIGVITGSLMLLTLVNPNKLVAATLGLGMVMLAFGIGMRLASNALRKAKVGVIFSMVAMLVFVAGSLAALSFVPVLGLLAAVRGICLVLLTLAVAMAIINKTSGGVTKEKGIANLITMIGMLVLAAGALALLALFDIAHLAASAIALMSVLLVLAVVMPIISRMKTPSLRDAGRIAVFIAAVLVPIGAAIALLAALHIDANRMVNIAVALATVLAAITLPMAMVAAFGLTGGDATAAAGLKGFATAIVGLILIITAIGTVLHLIEKYTSFDVVAEIERAGLVFTAIGEAIGGLVGGLIAGVGNVVFSSLSTWGTDIKNFLSSIEEGISKINGVEVDEGKMSALQSFATAILALTAAEVLDGIARFVGGEGTNFARFASQIGTLGPALKTFARDTRGVNGDRVKPAAEAVKALADVAATLGRKGGWIDAAIGHAVTLGEFAADLDTATTPLNNFATEMAKPDSFAHNDKKIEAAATAIKAMADVAANLGRRGGLIDAAIGKPVTLGQFAVQMWASIPFLTAFANAAPKIADKEAQIRQVAGAIGALVEVANSLRPEYEENFWSGHIEDAQTLGEFFEAFGDSGLEAGIEIGNFKIGANFGGKKGITSSLIEFATEMATINMAGLDNGVIAIGKLMEIAQSFQTNQESIKVLGGLIYSNETNTTNGLESLATMLERIAPAFSQFADYVGENIDLTVFDTFATAVMHLANAEVWLSKIEYGGTTMETFSAELWRSASNFANAANILATADMNNLESWFTWISDNYDDLIIKGTDAVKAVQDGMESASMLRSIDIADGVITPVMDRLKSSTNEVKAKDAGRFLVDGFVQGIRENIYKGQSIAWQLSEATIQAMRRALRIASPSRVMQKLGGFTGEGFVKGLANWIDPAANTSGDLASSVAESAEATLDYLSQLLNGELVVSMTIRPVLDLTDVQSGAMAIDSMFTQRQALAAQLDADALSQSDEVAELVDVSWRILREIQNGREIYLDGKVLAGSMNRRLGRMEGL